MIYLDDEIFDWIESHLDDDPKSLALKFSGKANWIPFAVTQIECRKHSANKLSETLKNRRFVFPTLLSAEQSTSDIVASFHASLIPEGSSVLDLTCGLGIDTFHFAQKAKSVIAVEKDSEIFEALNNNIKSLNISNMLVVNEDCKEYLKNCTTNFDIVYIDPARRSRSGGRVYALSDCQPNVVELLDMIRNISNCLIIKMSPMLDSMSIINELGCVTDIYAIGTHSECKELVAVVKFDHNKEIVTKNHAITLNDNELSAFEYTNKEERSSATVFSQPSVGEFLLVPYPSVSKLMPFRLLSARFNVGKLNVNSHLYQSKTLVADFPGQHFLIRQILPFDKATIKTFCRNYSKVNIATRNFPLTPDELRKRLKTKDGGDIYLFVTTLSDSSKVLILTSKP
ncbi:MAG: RsmD family RNA methyltransferase [Muribaculaceae bacterium]|nr:RsmD family RNA methyltransferase [Muribaculaceae bacterium]